MQFTLNYPLGRTGDHRSALAPVAGAAGLSVDGEANDEFGPARDRLDPNGPSVLLYDTGDDVQSQTGSLPYVLCGKKWIEDAGQQNLRDARPGVRHL